MSKRKLIEIKLKFSKKIKIDKFGYTYIKFFIRDSNSYLKFLYTPTVNNFEKTKYKVKNFEELFVFVQEFIKFANALNVRYFEVFVTAYNPEHQKNFYDAGLSPRGYVPSWEYNSKRNCFEDNILFNYYRGNIDKKLVLFEESKKLIQQLEFDIY